MKIQGFDKLPLILFITVIWVISVIGASKVVAKIFPNNILIDKTEHTQKVVEEESVVIDVVEKVSPSVVSIAVENRQLFNPFTGSVQPQGKQSGIGTGFVVTADGLIVTNKHVVSEEGEKYIAIIKGNDGTERKLDVEKITRDPFNDLALVKVNANDLKPVEMGDSDKLKVGQKVIAIGNALGEFENTVTTGVVSGLGRGISPIDPSTGVAEKLDDLIQTDAAIVPGNSGGPLVNSSGQVIGMNTAIAGQSIGFAIKVNVVKQLIDDFNKSGGKISRPLLGIRYTYISREVALLNEVPEGEFVREVVKGSGADDAGIKVGDIITQIDNQKLTDEDALSKVIRTKKVGDTLKLKIFRDNKTLDLSATLGESSGE